MPCGCFLSTAAAISSWAAHSSVASYDCTKAVGSLGRCDGGRYERLGRVPRQHRRPIRCPRAREARRGSMGLGQCHEEWGGTQAQFATTSSCSALVKHVLEPPSLQMQVPRGFDACLVSGLLDHVLSHLGAVAAFRGRSQFPGGRRLGRGDRLDAAMWLRRLGMPPLWPSRLKVIGMGPRACLLAAPCRLISQPVTASMSAVGVRCNRRRGV